MQNFGTRLLVGTGRVLSHPKLWAFLLRARTRCAASWLFALGTAGVFALVAWNSFNDYPGAHRRDGNGGHATIDFGGQYLMGRMLVQGYGRVLYHRDAQRLVLRDAYPPDDGDPDAPNDADNLMTWVMGTDDPQTAETIASFAAPVGAGPASMSEVAALGGATQVWSGARLDAVSAPRIGGPLYPPTHALLFYPLALLGPRPAYRLTQGLCLLLAFTAGLGTSVLSGGRIWWPVGAAAAMLFPGFAGSISLGQNAVLTLNILLWGWVLLSNGYQVPAGVVWGLFAFKPVWALAYFLVPVISRRWRMAVAMAAGGVLFAALTLPAVGWQSWVDWLHVGAEAAQTYQIDKNWIELSRDLVSLPLRWMDFGIPVEIRTPDATLGLIGWALLMGVLEVTVRWLWYRPDELRAVTGPGPAFLLLGAWMSCYHFMYYDVLLGFLPFVLLMNEPRRFLEPILVAVAPLGACVPKAWASYLRPGLARSYPGGTSDLPAGTWNVWVVNRVEPTLFVLILATAGLFPLVGWDLHRFSYDTVCLLALWIWSGWLIYWQARPQARPALDRYPERA